MRGVSRPSRRTRRDRESGASAIEFVAWTPLLFLFMFGSIQFGLAMFARHVAVTAAQEGARTAREQAETNTAWRNSARGVAKNWVNELIGGLVLNTGWQPKTIGPQGATYPEVGVSVSFQIVSAVPGWHFTIDATSQGPIECYYSKAGKCVAP
ncbi:TadE/TadG family type IV pilus assembly protein [Actinospica durhamensis]|uniref:TadE/TadG family type IV pilus assembly protein n=1 Tax=Actinospica durhamensis TaxID=1508375 RepID=UPI002484A6B9|nr:TadE family protein [Actinospica durhamensis]